MAEPVVAAPASEPAAAPDTSPDWAIPVGLGATALALAGVAMALRRRRRPYEEDVSFVPPVVTPPARPAVQVTPPARPETAAPASGFTMVREAPRTGASPDDSLLDRMVAAEPDAANPFTSRKARRRRARLILQSQDFQPKAGTPSRMADRMPATDDRQDRARSLASRELEDA